MAKGLVLSASILLLSIAAPAATEAQSMEEDIRHLLALTGSAELSQQVMEQIIGTFSRSVPEANDEFWDAFREQIDMDQMVDEIIVIYERHFTQEEIRELIAFYATDLGRKLIEVMPAITNESMAVGESLGAQWAQKAMEMLQDAGYIEI